MAEIYNKDDKPYPENRPGSPGPKRSKYSVWTIVAILIVLALLVWMFAFTYGEPQTTAIDLMKTGGIVSDVGVLTG